MDSNEKTVNRIKSSKIQKDKRFSFRLKFGDSYRNKLGHFSEQIELKIIKTYCLLLFKIDTKAIKSKMVGILASVNDWDNRRNKEINFKFGTSRNKIKQKITFDCFLKMVAWT